ncbi:ATP-dependent RNA helicase DbpA [Gynuella sunshinyii]|uniref:Superfamily II DNA and RNA helicase n=1 Tax=Gynuella sunshinyii YC6258 TaxID=1445510 RepID=A0A0C5VJ43_9GAMM|nr:ATP-dependent RNA helicase DbpA [Gynuella sunshinyii]AJQ93418.1 superfamily II DNA and RNA helicase [Gynuella sunshinyii YC6258]
MSQSFSELPLSPAMLDNLNALEYHHMTPVQAQALPLILAGRDVVAQAKTGSGKTAAFGIGLLHKLDVSQFQVQALVLCPTRELADQVAKEVRRLGRFTHNIKVLTLCGGMPLGPQIGSLEHGAHVIVGTPGRLMEHLRKQTLSLANLQTLVLDEADRMLDMGFSDAIAAIVKECPSQRQTLLFSATYPEQIDTMAGRYLQQPQRVEVESVHHHEVIAQHFYPIDARAQGYRLIERLLATHTPESTVIFCATRQECQELADQLADDGYYALAIHGDMQQRERDQVLLRFANRSCSLLIATDVAARGLDFKALDLVINYELPRDPEVYIHRMGRTGRAGEQGLTISLVTERDMHRLERIEQLTRQPPEWHHEDELALADQGGMKPPMVTIAIDGGKKNKIRPGDILGALTGDAGFAADLIGKIDIFPFHSYVAVQRQQGKAILARLRDSTIKGRKLKVRLLDRLK